MRHLRLSGYFMAAGLLVLLPSAFLLTAREPSQRIRREINKADQFELPHSISPRIAVARDLGAVDPSTPVPRVTLHFSLSSAQQASLNSLVKSQSDRTSPNFHKWLTPQQFGQQFGLSGGDLQRVTGWLQSNGLTVTETANSKTWISFSGTAGDIQNAFGTTLHNYNLNGVPHIANATPVSLPSALNGVVASVRGLNDFHPKPHIRFSPAAHVQPHFTSNITGNTFLAPDDFATIYDVKPLYNSGINGQGIAIAVAGQTDIALSDIESFRTAAGLPQNNPQVVLTGPDPGTSTADLGEADLDIEWAGAVAPNATIIFVNSTDAFTSAAYAIDNNLAPVLSVSYGACEAQYSASELTTLSSIFQQGTAQGITTIAAGGDTGAADCDSPTSATANPPAAASQGPAVDVPSSIPYVTGMGGTTLTEGNGTYWSSTNNGNNGSALSYIPEVAWNDTAIDGVLSASGGGKSTFFTKPSWQMGLNVPNDGARDTPDVSLAASPDHDGYLICSAGSCANGFRNTDSSLNVTGGVSVAAPSFAAIVALLNQKTGARQGNINPGLYSLASISSNAFHDITVGNNIVPCVAGSPGCPTSGSFGFSAGTGYDQVTGLGSIDANNLVTQWGSDFSVAVVPTTLTVNPSTSNTASVQVSKLANFAGTVSFTCTVASPLTNTTCSIPGTVSGSGSATLTITNTTVANLLPPPPGPFSGPGTIPWVLSGVALLLAIAIVSNRKSRSRFILGGATLALLAGLTACDDGSSSSSVTQTQTPSETGNVVVTATSGVESHTATLSVTVP